MNAALSGYSHQIQIPSQTPRSCSYAPSRLFYASPGTPEVVGGSRDSSVPRSGEDLRHGMIFIMGSMHPAMSSEMRQVVL